MDQKNDLYDVDLKDCIDENLNYHYMEEGPLKNKFDNYTYNSIPYLKNCKNILDVGCGYGGPSDFLSYHNYNMFCITNSQSQYDAVSKKHKCFQIDACEFTSKRKYDIAVFFDSMCHMDAKTVINNIAQYTNKMFIKDYAFLNSDYYYSKRWNMHFRSQSNWEWLLSQAGFEIKHFEINKKVLVEESHSFWNKQVKNSTSTHRQIEMLKTISKSKQLKEGKAHCLLYAEKI